MPGDTEPGRKGGRPRPLNFEDALASVAAALPAWCSDKGVPRSWAHLIVGYRYVQRERARRRLDAGEGARMAWADGQNWTEWFDAHHDAVEG